MKLSNLRDFKRTGRNELDYKFFATVDVEEGWWLWKKVRSESVCRCFSQYWFLCRMGNLHQGFKWKRLSELTWHHRLQRRDSMAVKSVEEILATSTGEPI